MMIRTACGAGALLVTTMLSVMLVAFQAPASGQAQGQGQAQSQGTAGAPVGNLGRGGAAWISSVEQDVSSASAVRYAR